MGTFNVSLKTLTDRVSMEVVYTPRALDEISEVIGFAKLDMMSRPIVLMNVDGFYDSLVAFIDNMVVHGFISQKVRDAVLVANSAAEVAALLEKQDI